CRLGLSLLGLAGLPPDALQLAPELVPLRLEGGVLRLPDVGLALGDEVDAVIGLRPASDALELLLQRLGLLARFGGLAPGQRHGRLRLGPDALRLLDLARHLAEPRVHEGLGIRGPPRLEGGLPQPTKLLLEASVLVPEAGDLLVQKAQLLQPRLSDLARLARLLLRLVEPAPGLL